MLVENITRSEEVPHEPGNTFVFKMLTWVEVDRCRAERRRKSLLSFRETNEAMGADLMEQISKRRAEETATEVAAIVDPFAEYDKETLLSTGIASWHGPNYPGEVEPEKLDELTATWAGLCIVGLTENYSNPRKPALNADGKYELAAYDPKPASASSVSTAG